MRDLPVFFHTGLTVTDIDEAIQFFTEVMGLRLSSRRDLAGDYLSTMLGRQSSLTAKIAMLETDVDTFLELVEYQTPDGSLPRDRTSTEITVSGAPHFAFFVKSLGEFDEISNPRHLTPLALADETIPGGPFAGGKIRFYQSRFGCLIEVIQKP